MLQLEVQRDESQEVINVGGGVRHLEYETSKRHVFGEGMGLSSSCWIKRKTDLERDKDLR